MIMQRPMSGGSPRVVALGTLGIPVAALILARCVMPQPTAAKAAAVGASEPGVSEALRLSDGAWLRSFDSRPAPGVIEGTPFYFATVSDEVSEPVEDPLGMFEAPEVIPEDPPDVKVTAIMRSGNGYLVLIGGKATTIGGPVAPGWLLTSIDEQRRTVTIQNSSDGREVVLELDPPD